MAEWIAIEELADEFEEHCSFMKEEIKAIESCHGSGFGDYRIVHDLFGHSLLLLMKQLEGRWKATHYIVIPKC